MWPLVWILCTYILIKCELFVIKLCGISIILLTDLLWGMTSYYVSIDLRFVCIFKIACLNTLPRDTIVLHKIIIVCCGSVGNYQTLSKDGRSQVVNNIIFRPFVLFCASNALVFYLFLSRSEVGPTRVWLHCFHVYQSKGLYITWYSVIWLYFRFPRKESKVELCDHQCEFWVLIS